MRLESLSLSCPSFAGAVVRRVTPTTRRAYSTPPPHSGAGAEGTALRIKWKPPEDWDVLEVGLRKRQTCLMCSRKLDRGDVVMIRKDKKRHQFRCVDTKDCSVVNLWGREPVFRAKHLRIARQMDAAAGRA